MSLALRVLVILTGYVCGAIAGSVVLLAIGHLALDTQSWWNGYRDFAEGVLLVALFTGFAGLPVALPAAIYAEVDPRTSYVTCLLGGLLLGILMGSILNVNGFQLGPMIASIFASICGASTYWLISCFAFPPPKRQSADGPNQEAQGA